MDAVGCGYGLLVYPGQAMSTSGRPRWEYATLVIMSRTVKNAADGRWVWIRTADLSIRAKAVARWTTVEEESEKIGTQYSWRPAEGNSGEHNKVVQGPIDHLGDLGWELVSETIRSSAIASGSVVGWDTTYSIPWARAYLFKRIAGENAPGQG